MRVRPGLPVMELPSSPYITTHLLTTCSALQRLGPVGRYASTKMIYETSTVSIHLLQRNGDGEDGDSQNFDLFRSPAEVLI